MNLIVTAFPHEYKLVESIMERVQKVSSFESKCSRHNQYYHVLNAGQGRENCLITLNRIFGAQHKVEQVYCIGFCGGLSSRLKVGDIVYPNQVGFLQNNTVSVLETSAGEDFKMLTVSEPISTAKMKSQLYQNYGYDAVDMEAYHVVKMCKEDLGLSVQVVKCVMDDASQDLDQKERLLENIKTIAPKFKNYLCETIL